MFCTGSGNYWLTIFNNYAGSIPLLVITFFEIMVIGWAYGTKRFDEDLAWMIGGPKTFMGWFLHYYFRICWTFLSPFVLFVIFVAYVYVTATTPFEYDVWIDGETIGGVLYPWYGVLVIILLIALPLVCIPGLWLVKWLIARSRDEENEGILCDVSWSIENIKFWKNKYDKNGNLIR